MFLKFALKGSPALALAACTILVSSSTAIAQTAVSFGDTRNLPPMDTETSPETSNAIRLFTINGEESLPPVSPVSSARFINGTNFAPPVAQSDPTLSPPAASFTLATSMAREVAAHSISTGNAAPTIPDSGKKRYTVSFAQSTERSPSDTKATISSRRNAAAFEQQVKPKLEPETEAKIESETEPERPPVEPSDASADDPKPPYTSASPSNVSDSPREVLDTSTTGRTPTAEVRSEDVVQEANSPRNLKQVYYQNGHFYHQALLFEEPMLERHGQNRRPATQLLKSTVGFFGRSYLFPARVALGHHRPYVSGEDWELKGTCNCLPESR